MGSKVCSEFVGDSIVVGTACVHLIPLSVPPSQQYAKAKGNHYQVFDYLRSIPLSSIAAAQTTVFAKYNASLRWALQPVIDGEIIRRRPIDSWTSGPIMTGFTTNEGSLYVDKSMETSAEFRTFWIRLLPQLHEEDLDIIDSLYLDPFKVANSPYQEDRSGAGKMFKRIEAAYAHYAYIAPVRQTVQAAGDHVPVFLYHWALVSGIITGARHGDNMFYEMRDPSKCNMSKFQNELSGILHAYVTSFICTGDPNALSGTYRQRPVWAANSSVNRKVMVFGRENKELVRGEAEEASRAARLEDDNWPQLESEFWWQKVGISQQ